MRSINAIILILALISVSCGDCPAREIPPREIPTPETVRGELKKSINDGLLDIWKLSQKNAAGWKALVDERAAMAAEINAELLKRLGVSCEESSIAGVPVFIFETPSIPDSH